jgi:hypothetical protein
MAEDPHQESINLLTYRLNAVTIERDEWKAKFIQQNKDLGCEMMDQNGTIWDHAKKLQGDLAAVTEQRDRLAEALTEIARGEPNWAGCVVLAREVIQSLNQTEPESKDPHRFCRGGGGNNFHCGCKYDG